MGKQDTTGQLRGEEHRSFMRQLLADLRALERILADGLIEERSRRIGGEQEMFLVDRNRRPALRALDVLKKLDDPQFTTELGLFNLELNLSPQHWGGNCLSLMEEELKTKLGRARQELDELDIDFVLSGILPTIMKSDLDLKSMTPIRRYRELNRALRKLRGSA
jgi:hypothetical protein